MYHYIKFDILENPRFILCFFEGVNDRLTEIEDQYTCIFKLKVI